MSVIRSTLLSMVVISGIAGFNSGAETFDSQKVLPALTEMDLSSTPTHQQLSAAGQLGGVLSPTHSVDDKNEDDPWSLKALFSSSDEEERLAFGRAIQKWNKHQYSSAAQDFDLFRKQYPNSAWAAEATLHMACNARFTGQYSQANQLFNEIIDTYSDSDYLGAQQLVAKARSRLAVLRLMENNPVAAKALFSQVVQSAPDWRLRSYASIWIRKLSMMEQGAGLLDCGTRALAYLLGRDGQPTEAEAVLSYSPDNAKEGFSLRELTSLAEEYGYYATAVTMTVDELAQLNEPAILQIDRASTGGKGHYWVLEKVKAEIFHVFDPQMNRRFEFSAEQLSQEWQGNAIQFSKQVQPPIGNVMSPDEAENTYGGCCGIQRPPSESGDPSRNPDDSPQAKPNGCEGQGAPVWSVNMVNMNLYMTDTPMWYDNRIGPDVNIKLSYNTQGVLAQNEPFGNRWMFNYGSYLVVDPGKAVTIFEPDGGESVFNQDGNGVYQSDRYFSTTLTKNEHNQFTLTYADGYYRVYGVPEGTKALQNLLLEEGDAAGNKLTFGYDAQARMTHVEDALGQTTQLNYNAEGLIESVDDPFGRQARFEYDEQRNLVAVIDMQGYRSTLTYDKDRLITSLTDAKGTTDFYIEPADGINNNFDAYNPPGTPMWENYRITVTLPTGGKEEYYYDGYYKQSWYVDADHYQAFSAEIDNSDSSVAKTVYKFVVPNGRKGEISEVSFPDDRHIEYQYYGNNQLKSELNQFGEKVEYEWGDKGQLSKMTDSLGREMRYVYADNGLDVISIVGPFGEEKFTYDDAHQVTQYTDVDGVTTHYEYDDNHNLVTVTDANGVKTQLSRNEKGQVTSASKGATTLSQYGYDDIGRLIYSKDSSDYEHRFQYNQIDSLTELRFPSNRVVKREFGSCPRMLEKQTLPGEREYQYRYDERKQLTEVIDPMRGSVKIGRSEDGKVTSLTDQNNSKTTFEYTTGGRLSKKVYQDGSTLEYTYNKGRIDTVTNARGITKTYTFNDKQLLSKVSYSDETPSVEYQYNTLGQLSQVKDQYGDTNYQYSSSGQLIEIDGPRENDTIRLSYNNLDQLSELHLGEKLNTAYRYDDLGRVKEIDALGQVFTYQYTPSPLAFSTQLQLPDGTTRLTKYAKTGDLASIVYQRENQVLADYQYKFDAAGQLAEQTGTPAWQLPKQAVDAQYNELNQITQWQGDSNAFAYDQDGNPVKGMLDDGTPFDAQYDAENRLTQLTFVRGNDTYKENFGYAHNHMLANYQLYKNDKLVQDKQFVRLGLVELQQRDGQGQVAQEYAWDLSAPGGIGGLLITQANKESFTYLYNHLGHVQKVMNSLGQMVANYQYTPYGQVEGDDFSQQPFGCSTKRSDFESGLIYFGYRFYSPYQRRWLNRDPLHEQGGINLYAYVSGDPLGYIDLDGLKNVRPPSTIGTPGFNRELHEALENLDDPRQDQENCLLGPCFVPEQSIPPVCYTVCDKNNLTKRCTVPPKNSIDVGSGCRLECLPRGPIAIQ